jgi:hypothetical protein
MFAQADEVNVGFSVGDEAMMAGRVQGWEESRAAILKQLLRHSQAAPEE